MPNIALVVNDISATGYYGYGLRYGYTLGYGHRYYDPGNYYTRKVIREQDTIQMIKLFWLENLIVTSQVFKMALISDFDDRIRSDKS